MITINFEAATGADLRKDMLDLLGINVGNQASPLIKQTKEEIDAKVHETAVLLKEAYDDTQRLEASRTEETPKPEKTTRTRRSKAEIEAEAALAANTGKEEPPASTDNVETEVSDMSETLAQDNAAQNAITGDDLIKMAVAIARIAGAEGRDANLAMLEKDFGGATISKKDGKKQLTADQYPAVVEGFHRVITPFLPKLSDDQKKDIIKAGFNLEA